MSVDLSLIERSACDVVELLREEAVSPHDLLDTLAVQVARIEPRVNALPTLCFERAHAHADCTTVRCARRSAHVPNCSTR
ncbi:hypothetical protein [Paraburkholderia fynbosensis]|uniref:Amidase domain-containing protein n=1 Tax=Paraburkholderia fynbosensis TaxID=1200993 RepID=A0A6J5G1E8_9BURK|nr:hypothetical protein [Paraburkholderia fynbosensis]CAB3789266.1 hypothetical protein LMG27177_02623 [Paraburkholderia fynbosensis]